MQTGTNLENAWLKQLVGEWTYEFSTAPDPDGNVATAKGTERVWPIGQTWVVAENIGQSSDGSTSHSLQTLGFEPDKGRFVGVFAGTMAPVLFHYHGELGEAGKALVLETEGPALFDDRVTDKYRDIIRIIDSDHREQIAQVLDANGQWKEFMSTRYQRTT
jgi:Protein of unknown function (DUF1579)